MKIKILSLFSGIGAFEKALKRIDVDVDVVNYCEIDKYASKAYSLIHGVPENMNLGDITTIDTSILPKDIDLITYGFPCQDISIAGKQNGFECEGEMTRSGLFFEALRIIEETKPKFAICENVKNLTSRKFENEFKIVLDSLEECGYVNYWKVLNAKDYGIPQKRERVFIISIRKDIDHGFEFPEPFELELRLKDMLEETVDESFYIDIEVDRLIPSFVNGDVCRTVRAGGRGSVDRHSWDIVEDGGRIRMLTSKECFRLMGFDDEDHEILSENGISNTQIYKMAGNSIVVDVLEEIFVKLLNEYGKEIEK